MNPPPTTRHRCSPSVILEAPAWPPAVRKGLQQLIARHAGSGQAVALDFDNTLVEGDVTEAVQALLTARGQLDLRNIDPTSCPVFVNAAGKRIDPVEVGNAAAYYEALLACTAHGAADPAPCGTGYMWAVEALAGMRLNDVVAATREVHEAGLPGAARWLQAAPGGKIYPAPVFRPEMVELVARIIEHGLVPWIVSASNVWSVRWMVMHALNPLLRMHGVDAGVLPERVIGMAVLLRDDGDRLFKDALLVRGDPSYAALAPEALEPYSLTSVMQLPVPVYSGKVAALWDAIGERPLLAAGDSPGDHAMLKFARHRLWIERDQSPAARRMTEELIRNTGDKSWLVHPVERIPVG